MKCGTLINSTRGNIAARRVRRCEGFFSRMKGLLGTETLPEDEACWIIPCNSIHTVGMRYAIDVYFLSRKNEVLLKIESIKPNRLTPLIWKAHSVLEMKSGFPRNIFPGDQLSWEVTP